MTKQFSASDEFIVWAQSLSGMLTRIRTQYGSLAEMLESPEWDENKTEYAVRLMKSLHSHLRDIETEMSSHAREKYGDDLP